MTKKKKEIQMPKIENKTNIKKSWWIATGVGLAILFAISVWARFQSKKEESVAVEYLQKNVVNQYVCKIIGANPDEEVVAVECMSK